MKIVIDSREELIWVKRFQKEGFDTEVAALSIGDFCIDNYCFERKTWSDLFQSIVSGHLQKQLSQQSERYDKSFLIITGHLNDYVRFGKRFTTKEYITGFLAHLRKYERIIIIPCPFETHLPLLIKKIVEKNDEKIGVRDTELLRNNLGVDDLRVRILCSFQGMGIKKAEKALSFIDVERAVNNFINALMICDVDGKDWLMNIINKNVESVKNG